MITSWWSEARAAGAGRTLPRFVRAGHAPAGRVSDLASAKRGSGTDVEVIG